MLDFHLQDSQIKYVHTYTAISQLFPFTSPNKIVEIIQFVLEEEVQSVPHAMQTKILDFTRKTR